MNLLDGMLCALLIILVILGVLKGLVKIGATLGGLALAVLFAGRLSPVVGRMFAANGLPEGIAAVIAYGVVFLAIILAAAVAAWLVTRGLEAADVGWLNRLLGALAGLAMGLVVGSGVILGWTALLGPDSVTLRDSALAPAVVRGNDWLLATTPAAVKQRFREQRQRLETMWRERPSER
jgi:membrane protein required for colicin V production